MNYFKRLTARMKFPIIVVFNEKHGNDYFIINNPDELIQAFVKVFNERKEDWYFDVEGDLPTEPEDIFNFVYSRQDYEYEGFYLEQPSSLI